MNSHRQNIFKKVIYFASSLLLGVCSHLVFAIVILTCTIYVMTLWPAPHNRWSTNLISPSIIIMWLAVILSFFMSGFYLGRVKLMVLPSITVPSSACLLLCLPLSFLAFDEVGMFEVLMLGGMLSAVLSSFIGYLLMQIMNRKRQKPPATLSDIDDYQ